MLSLSFFAPQMFDPLSLARSAAAPSMLLGILVVHGLYFAINRRMNCQQAIDLQDLTRLVGESCGGAGNLTVVHGHRQQFDVKERTTSLATFPTRRATDKPHGTARQRLNGAQTFRDVEVRQTIICADDLTTKGVTIFLCPIKVAGDLLVQGDATFLEPVIVSGVLKVTGIAHFASGVVSKGDALVRGSLTVGSNEQQGWAVVRELAIAEQLKLNGTLVADRAVELRKAA